jgi:hypothetical protein
MSTSQVPSAPAAPHPHASANPLAAGCPVAHGGSSAAVPPHPLPPNHPNPHVNPVSGGCPIGKPPGTRSEPSADHAQRLAASHPFQYAKAQSFPGLSPEGEHVPDNVIPAAGRGNSEDGRNWVNPSANQLFRALMRKEKPIEAQDAQAVAAVHVAVTDNTWREIMEYEKLHAE